MLSRARSSLNLSSGRTRLLLSVLGLLGMVILGWRYQNQTWLNLITNMLMFLSIAQAWNLLGGYGGYLNLGMVAFFGLGAYTTAVLNYHYGLPVLLTAPLGGLVAMLYGVVVGIPSLRIRGHYFAILTLVTTFVMRFVAMNWASVTRGAIGIYLKVLPYSPRGNLQVFYFIFLGLAAIATLVVYLTEHSKFGNALVAIREDEDAAEILGVRATPTKIRALLIGAAIVGVVGGIYPLRISYIEPEGLFSIGISIEIILMTIIGGAGTWQGPIIGVPLVMTLAEVLRVGVTRVQLFGVGVPLAFNRVVFGALLVVVALFFKAGVMGLVRKRRGARLGV